MSENSKEETMKANTAATKIQANFRGYRVRKQLKETTTTNGAKSHHQQRDNGQQQRRYQHQQQHHRRRNNERESNDGLTSAAKSLSSLERQNTTREALEEKSATKIQAGIRGFLVRKRQQAAQAAATRIQAGFRGFRTRKLLKQNGQ